MNPLSEVKDMLISTRVHVLPRYSENPGLTAPDVTDYLLNYLRGQVCPFLDSIGSLISQYDLPSIQVPIPSLC